MARSKTRMCWLRPKRGPRLWREECLLLGWEIGPRPLFMRFSTKGRRHHTPTSTKIWHIDASTLPSRFVAVLSLRAIPIEELNTRNAILLAVPFLEIWLRLCFDGRLPNVAYSIIIQKMVNYLFSALLFLAVESSVLYLAYVFLWWSVRLLLRDRWYYVDHSLHYWRVFLPLCLHPIVVSLLGDDCRR